MAALPPIQDLGMIDLNDSLHDCDSVSAPIGRPIPFLRLALLDLVRTPEERQKVLDDLKGKVIERLKEEGLPEEIVTTNAAILKKIEKLAEEEGITEVHIVGSIANDARNAYVAQKRVSRQRTTTQRFLFSKTDVWRLHPSDVATKKLLPLPSPPFLPPLPPPSPPPLPPLPPLP